MLPKEPRLYLQLGLAYREFRLEPHAIEALTKAIELKPAPDEAFLPLIDLLDKTRAPPQKIASVLARASAALPNDLRLQLRSGEIAFARDDFGKAIVAFKRALELEPSNVEANFKLGLSQVRAGSLDAATQTYDVLKYLDAEKADTLQQAMDKAAAKASAGTSDRESTKGKRKNRSKRRRR